MTAMLASGDVPNLHVSISRVSMGRPFTWLYRGWMDMRRNWGASLGHGALIVALGWTVLIFCGTHPYYVAAALSGFLLASPIISAGPGEMSRRYESGRRATFDDALDGFVRKPGSLFAFGGTLALCAVIWFAVSAVMLESVFHVEAPSMQETLYRGFIDQMNRSQVEAYFIVGGALAALVFVLSVVSVPLIIDKNATAGQAMATSVRAAFTNIPAMIVVLTVIGYAPLLFGLLIIGPLLGHATWHAYKDMVH
jgi:uncharacterized membrane protein